MASNPRGSKSRWCRQMCRICEPGVCPEPLRQSGLGFDAVFVSGNREFIRDDRKNSRKWADTGDSPGSAARKWHETQAGSGLESPGIVPEKERIDMTTDVWEILVLLFEDQVVEIDGEVTP